jgi:uncharacterized membrane protein YbhN (UPF0104 family)
MRTGLALPARWGLRLLGLGAIVWFLVSSRASLEETFTTLALADRRLLALGFVSYAAGVGITALRLGWLLRSSGRRVSVLALCGDLAKGTALNTVMLSGAGELYRIQCLRGRGFDTSSATSAILLDRVFGLLAFATMGLLGAFVLGARWHGEMGGVSSRVVVFLAVASAVAIAVGAASCAGLPMRHWLEQVRSALPDPRNAAILLGLSFAMVACWVTSVRFLAASLGLPIGFGLLAFAAPLVAIASLFPLSVGGIGIREAGYAVLLTGHGVTTSDAVALGLTQYACYLLLALGGGIVLLLEVLSARGLGGRTSLADRAVYPDHDLPATDEGPTGSTR